VARVFSSPADKVSRVEDDADILRFLASHDFPAERLAHDEPVSVLDGGGVIVTEFVEGGRPTDALGRVESPAVHYELASLLGRLHTLPAAGGAVARDGGSEEHDGGFYVGRPKQDLAAAMSFLVSVEDAVAPEGREKFEWLRDQVENADDAGRAQLGQLASRPRRATRGAGDRVVPELSPRGAGPAVGRPRRSSRRQSCWRCCTRSHAGRWWNRRRRGELRPPHRGPRHSERHGGCVTDPRSWREPTA
jgi:hypothetical protein